MKYKEQQRISDSYRDFIAKHKQGKQSGPVVTKNCTKVGTGYHWLLAMSQIFKGI